MTTKAQAIEALATSISDAEHLAQQYAIAKDSEDASHDVYTFTDNSVLVVGINRIYVQ